MPFFPEWHLPFAAFTAVARYRAAALRNQADMIGIGDKLSGYR